PLATARRAGPRWALGPCLAHGGEATARGAAPFARAVAGGGFRSPHARAEPGVARKGSAHRRALFPAAWRIDRRRGDLARHRAPASAREWVEPGRRAAPAARARPAALPRARPPHDAEGAPHGRRRRAAARPPGHGRRVAGPFQGACLIPRSFAPRTPLPLHAHG